VPNCKSKRYTFYHSHERETHRITDLRLYGNDSKFMQVSTSIGILDLMVLDGHYSSIKYLFKVLESLAEEKKSEAIIGMFCKNWANKYSLIKYGMIKTNIFSHLY